MYSDWEAYGLKKHGLTRFDYIPFHTPLMWQIIIDFTQLGRQNFVL